VESADGTILRRDRKKINTLLQASLAYDNTFAEKHHLSALALYEESKRDADNYWVQRYTVFSTIEEMKAGTNTNIQGTQDSGDDLYTFTNKGFIGKVAYDYLSKYLVDFSFRYDGSSRFGPGYQWGFFPVASIGWRPSEEAFIKDNDKLSFISNLKIRASYGVMGDDSFADYQFLTGFEYPYNKYGGGYVFNDKPTSGLQPLAAPNKSFTWVTSKTLDIGLDFELWSGLLGGTVDVFRRDRSGFLGKRTSTLPGEAGIDLSYENINSDYAQGFELTLTHRNKIGNDFRYNLSAQVAMDRNKIKHYETGAFTSSYNQWEKGFEDRWGVFRGSGDSYTPALGSIWGYNYQGQYQNMQQIWDSGLIYDGQGNLHMLPGDLIYEDWNGDGVIDGNDKHAIGKTHNALSYGISIGAEWKGIDVAMVWQGTGHNRRNAGDVSAYFSKAINNDTNGLEVFLDRWHRADEMVATIDQEWIPGYYPSNYTNNNRDFITEKSNFWFLDATYLRLKTLEVGYTIPTQWTKKIGLQRARLFFNGYNLLTFTKYTIMDPEQSGTYPLVKSFNGGINLRF
jgi:TonB-linked SusC/RagA family outer membrane protein